MTEIGRKFKIGETASLALGGWTPLVIYRTAIKLSSLRCTFKETQTDKKIDIQADRQKRNQTIVWLA